jgi:TolB-like protein
VFGTRRANRVAGSATDGNDARSIAVLPFVNIGSDSGNEYFSDGITEELINTLARVQGFHVPARTSSFAFKGKSIGVTEIGRQLHVGAVLEGSVRRSGKELRVTAQLIDVASGYELWSDVYDRELTDILRVEEEIARAIAAKLRGALLSDSTEGLASKRLLNPEAHDLYLRGRYFWNQRNELSLNKSIQYFERALALDPEYAMAYAGLADSYVILGANGFRALGEVLPKAEAAANKAIALDGSISSVHATRALIHWLEWKWPTAEDEFRRSIALDSAYVPARLWYALYLSGMGHSAEAIREITRARELDPLSLIVNTERGRVLELARRDTAAIEAYAQALEIDSTYELANSLLAQISLRTRRFELADQAIARLMQSSGTSELTNFRAYGYAVRGNGSAARQALAQLTGPPTTRYVSPYSVACIYAALHETRRALEWLEKAYAAHSSEMTALAVDPALDPVRTDPQFRRLMRRMHLDE